MNANIFSRKIEMTKAEAKAAGKIDSDKFNELRDYMEAYPGYEIQIKAAPKRKVELKGLDYKYMRNYIQKSKRDDKDDIMATFNTLTAQDKKDGKELSEHLDAASYMDVKKWFLATFPEIQQYRHEQKKKVQNIRYGSAA
jgi:CRISPR/Cas system CSM-associated protein Csm4 (group 5 of RAMP superfamily)